MKTYGHLRQEHSQAQAAKVSFGEAPFVANTDGARDASEDVGRS